MVWITTNAPTGPRRQSVSMSREAVRNLNQCGRVGIDRGGAASRGSKTLPWTAGIRKERALPDGSANG
jgi:hypothetical protein